MNTLIISPTQYPNGSASATYLQLMARGLLAAGGEVRIIGLRKGAWQDPSESWNFDTYGVPYKLLPFLNGRFGKFGKLKQYFFQLRRLYRHAIEEGVRSGHCDSVIIYGQSWHQAKPSVIACKALGIPVFSTCVEWWRFSRDMGNFQEAIRFPALAKKLNGVMNKYALWDHEMFRKRLLPQMDGMIAISRLWEDYGSLHRIRVVRIPSMSNDCVEATKPDTKPRDEFRLVYVGMMHRRDLPKTLLDGFRNALKRGLSTRLVVVGDTDVWPQAKLAKLEASTCPILRGHVEFTGRISDSAMDEQRSLADAFVLLRDNEWESNACFPTRLPEYLLTAKPVIISEAGDIPLYLQHKRDAWLLPTGDRPNKLADAILALASNPEEAHRIGRAGRETALREFSFRVQGPRLMEFLKACKYA